jgi:hypothetical protein
MENPALAWQKRVFPLQGSVSGRGLQFLKPVPVADGFIAKAQHEIPEMW